MNLSELKDIHWPEAPSIWPLAIGYYLVILFISLVVLAAVYFIFWGLRKRKLKKAIAKELFHMEERFYEDRNVSELQGKLTALLKRLVFYRYQEKYGRASELLELKEPLLEILPGAKTEKLLELLTADRFQKAPKTDGYMLINLAREQIKRCRI